MLNSKQYCYEIVSYCGDCSLACHFLTAPPDVAFMTLSSTISIAVLTLLKIFIFMMATKKETIM